MPGRVCSVLYTGAKLPEQGETVLMRTLSDLRLDLPGTHVASGALWGPALLPPPFSKDTSPILSYQPTLLPSIP